MQYISVEEVLELHRRVVQETGGAFGIRDRGSLESSVLQPLQSFGDQELYPTLSEKAAALERMAAYALAGCASTCVE